MSAVSKSRLKELIREISYKEGDFTLASGQKSTFYIDVKRTTLHPEGALLVGELAVPLIVSAAKELGIVDINDIGGVGGLTLGADPIATSVSIAAFRAGLHWPAFLVRKEVKGYGTGKVIEGRENLKPGGRVIIVEDVVTTGGSGIQAVEKVRAEGFKPVMVFAVVDREQGGREAFAKAGLPLYSLFTISDIKSS